MFKREVLSYKMLLSMNVFRLSPEYKETYPETDFQTIKKKHKLVTVCMYIMAYPNLLFDEKGRFTYLVSENYEHCTYIHTLDGQQLGLYTYICKHRKQL